MKNFPQIIAKVYREPWLIVPHRHRAIQTTIEAHMDGGGEVDMEDSDTAEMAQDGDTAIIPVYGIIGKHLSMLETMCGGCDLDVVGAMIDAAENDLSVKRILLNFRTPGGTVTGVPEMGRKIAAIKKPTIAFTDSECCSAGYWLASQCKQFFMTESATTGSIGVYSVYEDWTKALAMEGIKVNAISSGKFKLSGAYFKEMTDEERAMFQAKSDKIHSDFKAAARHYREIPDEAMQGQCFDGVEAVNVGLVDGLVEDIGELLS